MKIEFEVDLDDELLATAKSYSGLNDTSEIIEAAMKVLVERERAKRDRLLGIRLK